MPHDERAAAVELHRLAQAAHARGLRLFRDNDGRWLATSASDERLVHYVTAYSCDCRGFCRHQRCSHLALLLDTLGWLPPLAEGRAPTPITCTSCTNGHVESWVAGHIAGSQPCDVCHGTRYVPPIAA